MNLNNPNPNQTKQKINKMNQQNEPNSYSIDIFWRFSDSYHTIHGWLASSVLIIGLISNILNITVLTRSNMVNSLFLLTSVEDSVLEF